VISQQIADLVLFLLLRENVARNILECRDEPHLLILGRDILTIGDKYVNSTVYHVPWRGTQQKLYQLSNYMLALFKDIAPCSKFIGMDIWEILCNMLSQFL
jgi:hypothetical protein